MAEVVREREIVDEPAERETVVVRDQTERPVDRGSNTGMIVAVIVLVIILALLFFGRGLFSRGSGGGGGTNINVQPTTTTPTTGQ